MASIKRFRVSFNGGLPDMIAFGITKSSVARKAKALYGPAVIAGVTSISARGAEGMAFMPLPWNSISEAGYMDPPKTKEEIKKRHPNIETDVKNKKSKDLHVMTVKEAKETNPVIASMNETLSSAFTLYLKSQNFHWNVQGPDFDQYHNFFGKYYNFVYEHVDKIAEQIRALNAAAPGSMVEFMKATKIAEAGSVKAAAEMFSTLSQDNQTMIDVLTSTCEVAEAAGKKGLVNYLEGAIEEFNKFGWMLRSVAGTSITEGLQVKGVKITDNSPDANKDGKVDEKDDLNKDGVVDAKDLKIAQLEKDLKIKQLETDIDAMDEPEEEEESEPVYNIPARPSIKDRGDHYEVMDHRGNCLKKCKYDPSGEGTTSRQAKEDAKRFVSKWYHDAVEKAMAEGNEKVPMPEEFVRVSEKVEIDGRTKAFKETAKRLLMKKQSETVSEDDPCWDGYKKVPGKKDYEDDSCVKEEESDLEEKGLWDNIHAKRERIKNGSGEKMRKPGSKGAPSDADLKASQSEEKMEEAINTTDRYIPHPTRVGVKVKNPNYKEPITRTRYVNHPTKVGVKVKVSEEETMEEGNAFIYAAAKAKQQGKKTFVFNGKTYKVTIKSHSLSEDFDDEEVAFMAEAIDAEKLTMLARAGMVSRDQLATLKMAMKSMEDDKPLRPAQREVIVSLFSKLADLATNDQTVFQKAKKFAKEETEYTSANFYADYIKNTKR
jgi:starvation-inducible DNA-binding protein